MALARLILVLTWIKGESWNPPYATRVMNIHAARDFSRLRHEMVDTAIVDRGVRSELVLNAMRKVRREAFLPKSLREFAYEDTPLPIEGGQTISQPYIVAFMVEALELQGRSEERRVGKWVSDGVW